MEDVKSAALRIILAKRRTEKEVASLLEKRGFSPEDSLAAATYYRQLGYIDHKEYATRFVHDAAHIKGFGPLRIRRALSERGIEDIWIEDALSDIEFDIAKNMESRFGSGNKTAKEIRHIYQHFIRKGFTASDIKKAIDKLYIYELYE